MSSRTESLMSSFYTTLIVLSGVSSAMEEASQEPSTQVVREDSQVARCWNSLLCKPGSEQVWANSTVRDNLKRDKRDRTLDNEDPGEGSWPSIEKIIRDVERNLRERENYPSVPYSYGWDSSQLADPFREEEAEGRRGGQRKDLDVASMLRDLPLPSRLTTSRPFNTERFIYRRVAANEKKILAISIRRSLTTTLPPHHRNAQWQEVSNSKAHLHHRWLQKGKLRGKLLT